MSEQRGEQVMGPVVELAAKVKAVLEADPSALLVKRPWGNYYVKSVELMFYAYGDSETVGFLAPDEAEGDTFDLYLPCEA